MLKRGNGDLLALYWITILCQETWRFALAAFYRFLPQPSLAAYVEAFYYVEGSNAFPSPGKERSLPTGRMGIIVNLDQDTLRVQPRGRCDQLQSFHGSVFSGASSEFSVIDMETLMTTISVQFKPGGAYPFLPMPATELTNQAVELSSLWGKDAAFLREQLQIARTPEGKVRVFERFLLARAAWEQTPHPAVAFALATFQATSERRSVLEVAENTGLSTKHFINLFGKAVGLTPKVFCRVLRFQEALQLLESGQLVQWADLAMGCGYFDQAHFIHDFQAFAGLTPGAYLARRREHYNHVRDPD